MIHLMFVKAYFNFILGIFMLKAPIYIYHCILQFKTVKVYVIVWFLHRVHMFVSYDMWILSIRFLVSSDFYKTASCFILCFNC